MDKTFDVQCELTYVPDYPPLYNDPELTEFVKNSLESMNDKEIKKVVEFPVFSGSEDFSYLPYLSLPNQWPRLFAVFMNGTSPLVFVCKKNGETHKTPFGINERCFMGCDRQ
jgi:metal-dependent amidase/aminoacylase/carboxypeptidase family protein